MWKFWLKHCMKLLMAPTEANQSFPIIWRITYIIRGNFTLAKLYFLSKIFLLHRDYNCMYFSFDDFFYHYWIYPYYISFRACQGQLEDKEGRQEEGQKEGSRGMRDESGQVPSKPDHHAPTKHTGVAAKNDSRKICCKVCPPTKKSFFGQIFLGKEGHHFMCLEEQIYDVNT